MRISQFCAALVEEDLVDEKLAQRSDDKAARLKSIFIEYEDFIANCSMIFTRRR